MDTELDRPLLPWWRRIVEWQTEATRTTLERLLDAQRTAVDSGVAVAESSTSPGTPARATVRRLEWVADVWEGTLSNTLVHLDDAITEEGVDLRRLQMIWLHAMDDAFSDVTNRPAFAAETNDALEAVLTEQRRQNRVRRDLVHASNLPTDRDVEEVGERLLDLEARQKTIEAKLDEIFEAVDVEETTRSGVVE